MLKKLLVAAVLVTVFAIAPRAAAADVESATYYTEMIGIPCFGCTWYPFCNCQVNPPIIIH